MKVFVTGATGVMGRSIVHALHSAGHDVIGLVREDTVVTARALGIEPYVANLFDQTSLVAGLQRCDAVCNAATRIPVGNRALVPGAWRTSDRIRARGSDTLGKAAIEAGVSRLVQESLSFSYADQGDEWIDESSHVAVNGAAEPALTAEAHAQRFATHGRDAVVLRFGSIVGDDRMTRWRVSRARAGRPVGLGDPQGWQHVVHPDDVGTAFVTALTSPSGIFNVGAEPVRRRELVDVLAGVAGRDEGRFYNALAVRLGGDRLEWVTRSQRVSSQKLQNRTGWKPLHPEFSAEWVPGDVRV